MDFGGETFEFITEARYSIEGGQFQPKFDEWLGLGHG